MKTLILLLILAVPAAARNSVAVKLIGSQPMTKVKAQGTAKDGGFGLGIGVEYMRQITNRLSVGADLSFIDRPEAADRDVLERTYTRLSGRSVSAFALMKMSFRPESVITPYIAGGVGMTKSDMNVEARPNIGETWAATGTNDQRVLVDASDRAIAYTARIGFETSKDEDVLFGLELGYNRTRPMTYGLTDQGREVLGDRKVRGPQAAVTLSSRVGFRF